MLRALADLLLPERCAGCGRPGAACCAGCRRFLQTPPFLARPEPCPVGLPRVWAVCEYGGSTRDLLVAHKERGRHDLSRLLGVALGHAVASAAPSPGNPVVLVPVPSRAAAARARGYDHTARLAQAAARRLLAEGHQVWVRPLLRLARGVRDQGGLGAAERAQNLAHAYEVRGSVPKVVVVVDDVMTTGSTLAEAARALRAAGAEQISAAVLAATRRQFGRALPNRGWQG